MTTFSFSTDAPAEVKAGVLILPVFQGPEFGPGVKETGLQQVYKDAKLTGKKGESLLVTKRNGVSQCRCLLIGVPARETSGLGQFAFSKGFRH